MTAVGEPLSVLDVAPVGLGARDVLVRIGASGLCHSDLLFLAGVGQFPPPMVLGHEGAGVVEEVGPDVRSVRAGDRVILSWVTPCGACRLCASGQSNLCDGLAEAWGEPKLRTADGTSPLVHSGNALFTLLGFLGLYLLLGLLFLFLIGETIQHGPAPAGSKPTHAA